jgi:hypothetical protein
MYRLFWSGAASFGLESVQLRDQALAHFGTIVSEFRFVIFD